MRSLHSFALTATLLALASPDRADAQGARSEVVATVERVFAAMAIRDTTALRALLAPDLVLVASIEGDGAADVTRRTVPQFLRAVASSPDAPHERMWSPIVHVDGAVATLWAPYDFRRGERFSHCGNDTFTLVREGERWLVAGLAYTVRPAPCPGPDSAPEVDIRRERDRFNAAIARRDTSAIGAFFLPAYHIVTGRSVQTDGAVAARHSWTETFRTDPVAVYVRTPREVRVNAPWGLAEELGDWDGRLSVSGGVARAGGSYAAKWQRTDAGVWRLLSEVFTTLRCDGAPAACRPPDPVR